MNPSNLPNNEPVIADEELKIPEGAVQPGRGVSGDQSSSLPVLLGVIIVLLVLILGGLYLWGSTLSGTPAPEAPAALRPTAEENNEPESTTADAQVDALETVSTSNSLEAIEADIESTNLDAIDTEMTAIEAELEAGVQE